MLTHDHATSRSELYAVISNERDGEDPWKGSTPECSTVEFLSPGAYPTVPMHVYSYHESAGCYAGKLISSCLSKIVMSKILSSLGSLSVIDMLRSTVKVYRLLMHTSLEPNRPHLSS